VQAAAYGGRPVSFAVLSPDEFEARSPRRASLMRQRGESVLLSLIFVVWIGGAILAWRNVRLGRCDRRGTLRVALWVFAAGMLAWLFRASHIAGGYEVAVLDVGLAQALSGAAQFWILYAAVEPYVRRLWPQALISWSRLVDGRWRDPLVGRNLLLGVLAGVAGVLALSLQHLAPWFGLPPQPLVESHVLTLAGPAALAGFLIERLGQGPGQVFALVVLLFLRLVLRKPLLAAGAFVALMTVVFNLFNEGHPVLGWFAWLLNTSLLLWVLTRLGYLAMIVMTVAHALLTQFPLTADLSAWYAPGGLTAVLVLLALAAFGFYTSQAGQPIFGPGPAEPTLG
jgi:serine/threonine-protein kinase